MEKPEYFDCKCSDCGHVIRFVYDKEENEVYTEVQLVSGGFFHRLKYAFKYLFKLNCKYGAWDCTILKDEDIPRLIQLLQKAENNEVSDRTD